MLDELLTRDSAEFGLGILVAVWLLRLALTIRSEVRPNNGNSLRDRIDSHIEVGAQQHQLLCDRIDDLEKANRAEYRKIHERVDELSVNVIRALGS